MPGSIRVFAGLVIPAVLLAGCAGSPSSDLAPASSSVPLVGASLAPSSVPSPTATGSSVPLYVVDRIMSEEVASSLPMGLLTGVRGTMSGGEVPEAFGERLLTNDPSLISFAYAAEAYDAVVLAALAAANTGSDQGTVLAQQASALTNGANACGDYAGCLSLLQQGVTIAYRGVSGATAFTELGQPTVGQVAVYRFGTDNRLTGDVEYREGSIEPSDAETGRLMAAVQPGEGDGVLTFGTLLDDDGALGFLSPAQRAGVALAVADVTAAGGVPGFSDVRAVDLAAVAVATPSTSPRATTKAPGNSPAIGDVDVVIGATSAMEMRRAMDDLAADGALVISPTGVQAPTAAPAAATASPSPTGLADPSPLPSPTASKANSRPATWSMSPAAPLQGAVLGSLPVRDGYDAVAILSNGDAYSESMADAVSAAVEQSGGRIVVRIAYKPSQKDFAQVVAQVKSAAPEAIVLTGGDESAELIAELARQGIGPNQIG